jgi:ABC-type xylose transport system substrate-binding protein
VLQINGSPTDAAAGLIKKGIHRGLDRIRLQDHWPNTTRRNGRRRRRSNGPPARSPASAPILGVVAANDGTGGGAIAAFKAAGVDPVPPVTGNDATIAALQLIIAGDQYNTISKPSEIVAAAAAKVAFQLIKGETPEGRRTSSTTRHLSSSCLPLSPPRTSEGGDHRQEDQRRQRFAPANMPKAARSSASSNVLPNSPGLLWRPGELHSQKGPEP